MISRIIRIARAAIISPEVVVGLILCAAAVFFSVVFEIVGKWYLKQDSWAIAIGPFGLLAFSLAQVMDILFPDKNLMPHLKGWPDYPQLKSNVFVGLSWCLLGSVFGFAMFVFRGQCSMVCVGLFFLISYAVPFVAVISLFVAKVTIRFILEKES